MNKRIKNFIIYGILLLIIGGFVFTPWFGNDKLWRPEENPQMPFSGIHFDVPTNINNFTIKRSETESLSKNLISYDIEFEYLGADSSMRIIGKLGEQAFFGDSVVPRHSKATLKGEYDAINNVIFDERLTHGELHKNLENYKFTSISEIRVPLSESVKNYKFRISYEPKKLIYSEDKLISVVSSFLTNARVDSFTDSDYVNESQIQSFNTNGMYVNVLEIYDQKAISSINFWNNVNNVIFILSIISALALIWLDKLHNPFVIILLSMITALTFYRFFEVGILTKGVLIGFPIIGIFSVLAGKQIGRDQIEFNKYDFTQSLGGALILFFFGLILYVLPKTF